VKIEEFEKLIESGGLNHLATMQYDPRFLVSLHVGARIQTDSIVFTRAEFLELTKEEAKVRIAATKDELEAAAGTKFGRLASEAAPKKPSQPKPTKPVKPTSQAQSTINYPAH